MLKALQSDELEHHGKYYQFKRVKITAKPLQQPHPPLWFAPIEASRAADAARLNGHIVTLLPDPGVKAITSAYRAAWKGGASAAMPLMGVFRHVVVAETDAKALDIARAAYRLWRYNMEVLWTCGGVEFPIGGIYPTDFDTLQSSHMAIAGSPETVRRYVAETAAATGINYFVADLAFGSISFEAASRSVDLFAREVMPQFKGG